MVGVGRQWCAKVGKGGKLLLALCDLPVAPLVMLPDCGPSGPSLKKYFLFFYLT
jgi:hypothetical protein